MTLKSLARTLPAASGARARRPAPARLGRAPAAFLPGALKTGERSATGTRLSFRF